VLGMAINIASDNHAHALRIIQLAEMATGQILLGDKSYACDVTSLPSIGTRHFPRRPVISSLV